MKIFAVSKDKKNIELLKTLIKGRDIKYSRFSPNMIFCFGGDGTFLYAERKYPGIPKLLVRSDSICNRCNRYNVKSLKKIISKVENHEFKFVKEKKLKVLFNGKELFAVNDIIIRNKYPNTGIRFFVNIPNKKYDNLIGDGMVVSSPFGSTGYFKSITGKSFNNGIGIGMNNLTKPIATKIIKKGKVKFELTRGEAYLCADNNPKIINLKPGDQATISNTNKIAKVVELI